MATSPSTEARGFLRAALVAEFDPAELEIRDDHLHPAVRIKGPAAVAGLFPVSESQSVPAITQETIIGLQIYLPWEHRVNPSLIVDPTTIEAYAERVREAVYAATHPFAGTSGTWDLQVVRVDYEDDPSGNRTRFTATIYAMGQNFAETTG